MNDSSQPQQIWMIRAGRGGDYVDDFVQEGFVGIGFGDAGVVDKQTAKSEIESRLATASPRENPSANKVRAAQVVRFYNEIKVGDWVATYDPNQRLYFLGRITSDVSDREHPLKRSRQVQWQSKVQRDSLKVATKNSLGAISAMFLIKETAAADLFVNSIGIDKALTSSVPTTAKEAADDTTEQLEDIFSRSNEYVEDLIASLDWSEMQDLVSEILKAMGYRTRVSQAGPDQGVDIFASPDGLGLSEPRVFVEVKHRNTKMGSQEIRAFLGGRQAGDRCLYVSTGGFSKDAKYEADRSAIPITLVTLPGLRELLIEHYENLSPAGKALVPLRMVYWPVDR